MRKLVHINSDFYYVQFISSTWLISCTDLNQTMVLIDQNDTKGACSFINPTVILAG